MSTKKGTISLINMNVNDSLSNGPSDCFSLETEGRIYFIRAESSEEKAIWIDRIVGCVVALEHST